MARALRRSGLVLALPAIVGAATLLYWLAGRRITGVWIMPDEAIYGERGLELWRHGTLTVLHGQGAGYSVLYPVLAGLPLSIGSLPDGYASLKLLQALVMSLAAVPVFVYGRRIVGNGYALLAAALTVASPLLLYSGFLMTEVVYYPLSAATLLVIARAVETGSVRLQFVAFAFIAACVLTRVQAVVFVAVFAAAILLDAALARDRQRLRRFAPVWGLLAAAAVAAAAVPGLFGAYAGTLTGGYPLGAAIRLSYDHLAYAVLMVAVLPLAALLVLLVREREPAGRALVSTASAALVLVVLQVGFFAARYAPHLLGRDLASLPPILFLVFALWLARGAPRPFVLASVVVVVVLAIVVGAPWGDLVSANALPDTMGIALVHRNLWGMSAATLLAVGTAAALVLFRFTPARAVLALPVVVVAVLVTTTVLASNEVSANVQHDQVALVGSPPDWVDRAVDQPTAYVFNGDIGRWNVVWQQKFWNRRIDRVVSLTPFWVPGPIAERQVRIAPDGRLPIGERYVVANDRDTFVGEPVAHQQRGTELFGLTLWRLQRPARISTIANDVKPNGDIISSAGITAFHCRGGSLQLTLLPKSSDHVEVDLDGKAILRASIGGLEYWNGTAYVPPTHRSDRCDFTIRTGLLLGSTRIVFARPG